MSHFQINPYSFPTGAPPIVGEGTWSELGRTTLGGVSDDVIVSGLSNKEYYMILADIPETVNLQPAYRFGDSGSPDTGNNYATRTANNGAQPGTTSNTVSEMITNIADAAQRHWFEVGWISNLFKHEKLLDGRSARNITGDNVAPFRSEYSGKWVNDKPLDTIALRNLGAGDFQIGTELIVLGYSRFDGGTDPNFWELLGETTATGSETIITTPVFTPRKYLWISGNSVPTVTPTVFNMRIGNNVVDSGSNYFTRFATNEFGGGSESPSATQAFLNHQFLGSNTRVTSNYFCINLDGIEKILHGRLFADGPGLVPPSFRQHTTVKWDGQSNALINIAQIFRASGTGALVAGSKIQVWGHD